VVFDRVKTFAFLESEILVELFWEDQERTLLLLDFLLLDFELLIRGTALSFFLNFFIEKKIGLKFALLALPCTNLGPNNYLFMPWNTKRRADLNHDALPSEFHPKSISKFTDKVSIHLIPLISIHIITPVAAST